MSGQIFISYRRDDASYPAGRLYDRLSAHFPQNQIFMDVDNLDPGIDFLKAIEESVGSCDVLIAVIGGRWLTATNQDGKRRLDDPKDFVRLEIATALKRGIRVIPVLVDGASMPRSGDLPDELQSLVRRNALLLSHDRFRPDSERLIGAVERALAETTAEPRESEQARSLGSDHPSTLVPEKGEETSVTKRYVLFPRPFIVALLALIPAALLIVVIANWDRSPNLSGSWSCNDGGIYTILQKGRMISWMGSKPPDFTNLFDGSITDQGYIEGSWHDLPNSREHPGAGKLTLKIENPSQLVAVSQTGNFGGSIWTKN